MARPVTLPIMRFHRLHTRDSTGCWVWQGEYAANGYGRFLVKVGEKWRHESAHRFSYVHFKGEIAEGMVIDHVCRNRGCVNPDHLRVTTIRDNILCGEGLAAKNAQKTHCPKGHEYTPDNTESGVGNRRKCRICRRESCRKWRRKAAMA